MEQTIRKMKSTLDYILMDLNDENYNTAIELFGDYDSLLNEFMTIPYQSPEMADYCIDLKAQLNELITIHSRVMSQCLLNLISSEMYIEANKLTQCSESIVKSIQVITVILFAVEKERRN